jgi:hypothetical protein
MVFAAETHTAGLGRKVHDNIRTGKRRHGKRRIFERPFPVLHLSPQVFAICPAALRFVIDNNDSGSACQQLLTHEGTNQSEAACHGHGFVFKG